MLKSSQMAAGVRVGYPSEPLGRKFVPRVVQEELTRSSRARVAPKMVHPVHALVLVTAGAAAHDRVGLTFVFLCGEWGQLIS